MKQKYTSKQTYLVLQVKTELKTTKSHMEDVQMIF
jgi:hypothetical protein